MYENQQNHETMKEVASYIVVSNNCVLGDMLNDGPPQDFNDRHSDLDRDAKSLLQYCYRLVILEDKYKEAIKRCYEEMNK